MEGGLLLNIRVG